MSISGTSRKPVNLTVPYESNDTNSTASASSRGLPAKQQSRPPVYGDPGGDPLKETKNNGLFILPGIGRLVKSKRKARKGRNPATGEAIKPGFPFCP